MRSSGKVVPLDGGKFREENSIESNVLAEGQIVDVPEKHTTLGFAPVKAKFGRIGLRVQRAGNLLEVPALATFLDHLLP